jgi:hypothetical protein
MLAEAVLGHLDRALEYVGDAVGEARAAVAGLAATFRESVPNRRPPARAKVREFPKPSGPVSDVDQQRAASVLKQRGVHVGEQTR